MEGNTHKIEDFPVILLKNTAFLYFDSDKPSLQNIVRI